MTRPPILKLTIMTTALLLVIGCQENNTEVTAMPINAVTETTEPEVKTPPPTKVESSNQRQPGDPLPTISSASQPEDSPYKEIIWDDLLPADYRPEVIVSKYMEQLAELDDNDPKAMELYGQIQAELENAPINEELNKLKVKLPGFIAPLENTDGKVTEFLLVPYYGACIHVPPPPVNQTVLIKTLKEAAIKVDNIYDPIWVTGEIITEGKKTDIGQAGYRIVNAKVAPYEDW